VTITPDDEGRESTGLVVQHSFSGDLQSCCSFRVLLAMGAQYNLILHQMDASTAFLKGELFEEVYMHQPEGSIEPEKEISSVG